MGGVERLGGRTPAGAGGGPEQREPHEQQLLERQPPAAALVVAEVRGVERRGAIGQSLERAQPGGQRLERVLRGATVLAGEREDLRAGEAVGGGVGRELAVGGADRLAGRRVERDPEAI